MKEEKRKYISMLSSNARIRLLVEMTLITGYTCLVGEVAPRSTEGHNSLRERSDSLFFVWV